MVILSDWLFLNKSINSYVFVPQNEGELVKFLKANKNNKKKLSIAGAQYSSGGQTLPLNGQIMIQTKYLDRILSIDSKLKTYTVEVGVTWRNVIMALKPHGLVPIEMQSYNSFTVGGSIAVNAHGRSSGRVGDGLLAMKIALSNGNVVNASPLENSDLFSAVIGGYGLIGIILTATFRARTDVVIQCNLIESNKFNTKEMLYYQSNSILYNANIMKDKIIHQFWRELDNNGHISNTIPKGPQYYNFWSNWYSRLGWRILSIFNHRVPVTSHGKKSYLSYEMGYAAEDLKPLHWLSRERVLLQEYFIPPFNICKFLKHLNKMERDLNILNISIRYIKGNKSVNGGVLNWAPEARVSVVLTISVMDLYVPIIIQQYKEWTQNMIDVVLKLGGTWYLPYFPAFNSRQIKQGYPDISKFLNIKSKYDPENVFVSLFSKNLLMK